MDRFDMTEELREKAQVSYEVAKDALENNNWDMTEAIIYLENRNTKSKKETSGCLDGCYNASTAKSSGAFQPISHALANIIKRVFANGLEVIHRKTIIVKMPLIIMVILLFAYPRMMIPVFILTWIFGVRYHFNPADKSK
ncbi:MAG: hypothetical protein GX858_08220 [Clostridiales bacterium]|nr:hypothetical protein [Clostridiales bacterium]